MFALAPADCSIEQLEFRLYYFRFKRLYINDIQKDLKNGWGVPVKTFYSNSSGNSNVTYHWITFDILFSEDFLRSLSDLCASENDINIVFI